MEIVERICSTGRDERLSNNIRECHRASAGSSSRTNRGRSHEREFSEEPAMSNTSEKISQTRTRTLS